MDTTVKAMGFKTYQYKVQAIKHVSPVETDEQRRAREDAEFEAENSVKSKSDQEWENSPENPNHPDHDYYYTYDYWGKQIKRGPL